MYDQREKAQRDYIWMMTGARQEGFVEGKEQGLEEGREQGIEEGIQRGKLAGKIQFAQELLGQTVSTDQELTSQNSDILTALLDGLRKKLKS